MEGGKQQLSYNYKNPYWNQ